MAINMQAMARAANALTATQVLQSREETKSVELQWSESGVLNMLKEVAQFLSTHHTAHAERLFNRVEFMVSIGEAQLAKMQEEYEKRKNMAYDMRLAAVDPDNILKYPVSIDPALQKIIKP